MCPWVGWRQNLRFAPSRLTSKLRCIRTECCFKGMHKVSHRLQAIPSKSGHHNSVIFSGIRKTGGSNVTVPNGLDLEYAASRCDFVKGAGRVKKKVRKRTKGDNPDPTEADLLVHRFQESKNLRRFSNRRPSGEADDIGELAYKQS